MPSSPRAESERALVLRAALARHRPRRLWGASRMAQAGVAMILRGDPTEILLIERASRSDDPWSGHVAFPGGRRAAGDRDLAATAVRETQEELGLDLHSGATLLAGLSPILATTHARTRPMAVQPFVFELAGEPALSLSREVRAAFWVPLEQLADPARRVRIRHRFLGLQMSFSAIRAGDHEIWGLTLRMLEELLALGRTSGRSKK